MQAHRLAVLAALLAAPVVCAAAEAQSPGRSVAGSWGGALEPGAVRLRLKLIVPGTEGDSSATLVSVDQGGVNIPATFSVRGAVMRVSPSWRPRAVALWPYTT